LPEHCAALATKEKLFSTQELPAEPDCFSDVVMVALFLSSAGYFLEKSALALAAMSFAYA